MSLITLPKTPSFEKIDERTSKFLIEGCYPGYGITLGNALRRVLLSSLTGAAVTEIKIKGATHEFTTLEGVKEDIVQIILNLKKVRFQLQEGTDKIRVILNTKGAKEVSAKDISLTSEVNVANPEQHIATLTTSKSNLEIEITVEKGVGYVAVEQREEREKELGVIAIDGLFSPIERVNFQVEDMRVGKRTDYDRIILEVRTDGTVTPEDAYNQAVQVLLDQFKAISTMEEKQEEKEIDAKEEKDEKKTEDEKKDYEISALELSTRIHNVLESNELTKVSEVAKLTEKELRNLSGMGNKGVIEIKDSMEKFGYTLRKND